MLILILPVKPNMRLVTDFEIYVDHFCTSQTFLFYVFFQYYTVYKTKATAIVEVPYPCAPRILDPTYLLN